MSIKTLIGFILIVAYSQVLAGSSKQADKWETVANGYWGSWKKSQRCPSGFAFCGMNVRIEEYGGRFFDDTGANGIRMVCCDIRQGMWAVNQTVIEAEDGIWGDWTGNIMCKNDTFVMKMDAKMLSKKAADDVAMGGAAIICNSLEEEIDDFNYELADYKYGDWLHNWMNVTNSTDSRPLYCGIKARFERKQGFFGDDAALNGYKIAGCIDYLKTVGGRWHLVGSKADGTVPLNVRLDVDIKGIQENQVIYTNPVNWNLTEWTKSDFYVYKMKAQMSSNYESRNFEAFKNDTATFQSYLFEDACKSHSGSVQMYQWVWVVQDFAGDSYLVQTEHTKCVYDNPTSEPLCPLELCRDEQCQYCLGFTRPKEIVDSDETIIQTGFDVDIADLDPEEEDEEEDEDDGFYSGVYDTTKDTMEGTYETLEGFFGSKTTEDVEAEDNK